MLGNVPMVTLWPEAKSEDVTNLWTSHTSHQPLAGLFPLPHSHSNSEALHWYKQTRKKTPFSFQTVIAELGFSENYHKLTHQYLALGTNSTECPTKFLGLLFATKPAGCHSCLSFRDRQTLPLHFSPKPRGRRMGQLPHWAASLVQWVFSRMNKH